MTARECLASDDPKAVGAFYAELRKRGALGERAFHLLRTHRNISRVRHYDDVKYMRFLRGRAEYSVEQLLEHLGMEPDRTKHSTVSSFAAPSRESHLKNLVTFRRDKMGEWKTTKKNESLILALCNQVTGEDNAES